MGLVHFILFILVVVAGHVQGAVIRAGSSQTSYLLDDGSVWSVGGNGATSPTKVFVLPGAKSISSIVAGSFLALRSDGSVWGFGKNYNGVLGEGAPSYLDKPGQLAGLTDVIGILVSQWGHVLALKGDGTVWSWGENSAGQLGDGTQTNRYTPAPINGLKNIIQVTAGNRSSLALRDDGTVWRWGSTCCNMSGDGLWSAAAAEMVQLVSIRVPNIDRVVAIANGDEHHLALKEEGASHEFQGQLPVRENLKDSARPARVNRCDHGRASRLGVWPTLKANS